MLGVQSLATGGRDASRFGRQLVTNLLASDTNHRFVLYTHEGFPTDRVPLSRAAQRVSLATIPGGSNRLRTTIQRVIDQNPDGLDWLLLLDPFESNYGGIPPEAPLSSLKVASIVLDLDASQADDRRLTPLRRHDAILAVSESTASDCRRRLGVAAGQVSTIGVASEPVSAGDGPAEPLTRVSGEELGRIGITGPFLFANLVGGSDRSNLNGIIASYHRLPIDHRRRHQLVIAGPVRDPWRVVAYLHERGCAEGLVFIGEVEESTLRMLYRRSAVFISPSIDEGCGLTLVEAMSCGSAIVAGRSGAQPEIIGDAGLLADPTQPAEIAQQISRLLNEAELDYTLRDRSVHRAKQFGWNPVVQSVLSALEPDEPTRAGSRHRFDRAHVARPRIAVFPEPVRSSTKAIEADRDIREAWMKSYNVDLYFDPEESVLADGISTDFGGFVVRQFDRNDAILRYHAVIYRINSLDQIDLRLARLRVRPGLVVLSDDSIFTNLDLQSTEKSVAGILEQLRQLFVTTSRLVVGSTRVVAQISEALPEYQGQIAGLRSEQRLGPENDADFVIDEIERCATELARGPGHHSIRSGRAPRVVRSTPHSVRSSIGDDEMTSRSR